MSDIYVEYEDGVWAVWSTIVEDWTAIDMTEEELVERSAEKAAERARKDTREVIEAYKRGDEYYTRHQPSEEKIEELRDG